MYFALFSGHIDGHRMILRKWLQPALATLLMTAKDSSGFCLESIKCVLFFRNWKCHKDILYKQFWSQRTDPAWSSGSWLNRCPTFCASELTFWRARKGLDGDGLVLFLFLEWPWSFSQCQKIDYSSFDIFQIA